MTVRPRPAFPTRDGALADHERRIERLEFRSGDWVYFGTYPDDPNTTDESPPFENGWHGSLRFRKNTAFGLDVEGDVVGGDFGTRVGTIPARWLPPAASPPVPGALEEGDGNYTLIVWELDADGHLTPQEAGPNIDALVLTSRVLTAGAGLSGGGDLSADRTFAVNVDDTTTEVASDIVKAIGLHETGGPTDLTAGAIGDGEYLRRSGSAIVGAAAPASSGGASFDARDLATEVVASTISNSKYNAFGIYDVFPDGTHLIVYREGTSHIGDAGVLKMRTSTDQGRTWSTAATIATESSVDLRNVAGGVTPSGRLVIFYGRYNPGGSAWLNQGYIYSDDQGSTWSAYVTVSHGSDTSFSPYGQLVHAGDDILLAMWYGDDGTNYRSRVIASTDDGATWGTAVVIANSTTAHYTETSLAYLGGSEVVAILRADNGSTFTQAISADNGATWSITGTVTFDTWSTASPPTLVVYTVGDGLRKVACYYANRTALKLRVVYADADDLINSGVSAWGATTDLATLSSSDSGYPAVIHPLSAPVGVGWYYQGTSGSVANIVFFLADAPTPSAPITQVESTDGSITVTNGTGPIVDLAVAVSGQHILLADGHATPFVFTDLLQMDDGSDFMWSDPE